MKRLGEIDDGLLAEVHRLVGAYNLGDDADTTAAIVQIAGAHYGIEGIPSHWLQRLWVKDSILALAEAIYGLSIARR